MKNFVHIGPRQLTGLEWDALRAVLPCQGGVPLLPGLLDELQKMGLTYFEPFVLKPVNTHDVSDTHYVLLGWQDDDDLIPLPYPPIPWIFGIYAVEGYRYHDYSPRYEALPSFDELYQVGLEVLRHNNRRSVRRGVVEGAIMCWLAGAFIASIIEEATHMNNTVLIGIVALVGIVGAVLGGLSNYRELPKPDEAPTTA